MGATTCSLPAATGARASGERTVRWIDPQRFRSRMEQSDIASELFFPAAHAYWHEGRYRLRRGALHEARSPFSGVRLLPSDPQTDEHSGERQCQKDVASLVQSVARLRSSPGLEGLVLSREILRCALPNGTAGVRVKFGLQVDARGRYLNEVDAARECHRRITSAIRRSGLIVVHPRKFDPQGGMSALDEWASELRLRRRRPCWPLLGLLLPLLALPLLGRSCSTAEAFFGVPIETHNLLLVLDKSSSMEPHFAQVQAEAATTLQEMLRARGKRYADIIAYDTRAVSALGGLTEVDAVTAQRLDQFLSGLRAGGGTRLRAGIEQAAREVAAHEQPTTLVILTDGKDESVPEMLADLAPLLGLFRDVAIAGNVLTPRQFSRQGDNVPVNAEEARLQELARALHGRFGPRGD